MPDDDLVEVETRRRNINNKWLFIIDCAIYRIKYCIINLSHEILIRSILHDQTVLLQKKVSSYLKRFI